MDNKKVIELIEKFKSNEVEKQEFLTDLRGDNLYAPTENSYLFKNVLKLYKFSIGDKNTFRYDETTNGKTISYFFNVLKNGSIFCLSQKKIDDSFMGSDVYKWTAGFIPAKEEKIEEIKPVEITTKKDTIEVKLSEKIIKGLLTKCAEMEYETGKKCSIERVIKNACEEYLKSIAYH